jgi:phosphoenolpyruvate synthase/pyruvate phosphate dikinase
METTALPDSGLVRSLGEVGIADRPAAGGKGAGLGELRRAGLPVPAGFVVTTQAFECALRAVDPSCSISRDLARLREAGTADLATAAADIRTRIIAAPIPASVESAVRTAYRALGGGPVAVRSSATGEDAADASFAGLQDTYLWISGDEQVLEHVRRCWASLYNLEALSYRLRQMAGSEAEPPASMAVVVQRMIDPRCAGVMFSCSPTTGDRSVVAIEGSWGLGSVLVGGEVTPDSFVVSKVTGEILRRTVSLKDRLHRQDPVASGTVTAAVPQHLRAEACLTDDEIRSLTALATRVERHYGTPQDIEWAVEQGTGTVMLLQSRRETVWAARRTAAPLAAPKARPADHVFEQLSRVRGATWS